MEIPKQNRAELFSAYVLRVCSAIDNVRIPTTGDTAAFKETDAEKDERHERVNGNTAKISLSACQSTNLSVCLSVSLSNLRSVCLTVCLSVCMT
jgi:hypothetical protein